MATKKSRKVTESLLSSVARQIGHAAGSLAKATHDFNAKEKLAGLVSAPAFASGIKQTEKPSIAKKKSSAASSRPGTQRPKKMGVPRSPRASAATRSVAGKPPGQTSSRKRNK